MDLLDPTLRLTRREFLSALPVAAIAGLELPDTLLSFAVLQPSSLV
ncbi:MAG: hypothetical protein QN135_03870 [Armatimonadota bacterium]|nr:hypothetical protein [Armatimonadota bacterium]